MDVVDNIVRGFRAEISARILFFATTGAVLIFLARFLSPGAYGLIFLAFSILSVIQLFADLAIPNSAAKYIAEYEELNPEHLGYIVTLSFVVVFVASTVVTLVVVVFHQQIAALFDNPDLGNVLLVGAGLVFCRALYLYFRKILQGFTFIKSSAIVYATEGVGRLVFIVGLVSLGFSTAGAIGGYALGFGSAAVLGGVFFYHQVYPTLELTLSGDATIRSRILQYSLPLLGIRASKVADSSVGILLIGFFLTPTAVGFYSLSAQAVHLLQAPASALGFSAGPWFGNQKASGNTDRITEIYTSSLVYTLLFYVPVAAGVAVLAQPALGIIFGDSYLPATDVLQILSVLVVLRAVEELSENAIDFLGRARERSVAKGITVLGSLAGMVVLIPPFGIVGAALAKVVTHAAYVLTLFYIMHTEVDFSIWPIRRHVTLILVVTLLMTGAVVYATKFISGLLTLAAVVVLGGAIWATLALLLGLVDTNTVASLLE